MASASPHVSVTDKDRSRGASMCARKIPTSWNWEQETASLLSRPNVTEKLTGSPEECRFTRDISRNYIWSAVVITVDV